MKSTRLGIASAFLASLCCVVPVGLAVLGLGGLGVGAFISANHWYLIVGAGILLALSWYAYLRERRRCETEQCELVGGKAARITLPIATLAVVGFLGLNLYTYAGADGNGKNMISAAYSQVIIPVEGMTCYSCSAHVEHSLIGIEGVQAAKASVPDKSVTVNYNTSLVSVEKLVEKINRTGYRAKIPSDKPL